MSDLNRKINIYLDGKPVENNVKSITNAMNKLVNQQRLMTIGADDYLQHAMKIQKLRGILDEHKRNIGAIATEWGKIKEIFKANFLANITGEMATNAFTKLAAIPGQIVNYFSNFQKGFSNVETNLSVQDREKYGGELAEAVKQNIELGQAVDDVNKAMFDSVSSGIKAGEARKFLADASEMAIGGNARLATSIDGLTTIINAYNLKAREAKNISAGFFATQFYGKTTVQELSENIGEVIPIAKSLGITYQEVLSSTAALTLGGLKTTMAVTYLKGAFKSLLRPTVEAIPYMKQLGIPMGVTEVRAKGLGKALQMFTKAVRENPDVVAKAIPDLEGLSAVLAMSGDGFERYNEILGVVNDKTRSAGMLADAFRIKQETVSQTIERLKGRISVAATNLGEKMAPAYMKLMAILGSLLGRMIRLGDWLIEHGGQIKFVAKVVLITVQAWLTYVAVQKMVELWSKRAMAAKMIETLIIKAEVAWIRISTAATSLYALIKAKLTGNTLAATRAMSAFNIAVRANPLGILISLIGAVGTAYLLFRDNVNEATKAQEKFNAVTQNAVDFDKKMDMIHKQAKILGQLDAGQLESFKAMTTDALEKMTMNNEAIAADIRTRLAEAIAEIESQDIPEAQKKIFIQQWKDAAYNETKDKQKFYENDIRLLNIYLKRTEELLKKKVKPQKNETGNSDIFAKEYELKKRLLDEFAAKYKDFLAKLKQIRDEFNMQDLSENEREILQIRQKFEEEIRLIKLSKSEMLKKANDEISDIHENRKKDKRKNLTKEELRYIEKLNKEKKTIAKQHDEAVKQYEIEMYRQIKLQRTRQSIETGEARLDIERKYTQLIADEQQKVYFEKLQKKDPKLAEFEQRKMEKINAIRSLIDELDKLSEGKTAEELEPIMVLYGQLMGEIDKIQNSSQKRDLLGMTESDWEKLNRHFRDLMGLAGELQGAWKAYNDYQANQEAQELASAEKNHDLQAKMLEKRLQKGIISQEVYDRKMASLDESLDKKKRKIDHDQAVRAKQYALFDMAMKTAQAVLEALPNIPLSIAIGLAGGMEIAAVASRPIPEYAAGGYVNQDSVIRAGEKGKEWIASNKLLNDPVTSAIIADLQKIQEGKKPSVIGRSPVLPAFSAMNKALQPQPVVVQIQQPEILSQSLSTIGETTSNQIDIDKVLQKYFGQPINVRAHINYNELTRVNSDLQVIQGLSDMKP